MLKLHRIHGSWNGKRSTHRSEIIQTLRLKRFLIDTRSEMENSLTLPLKKIVKSKLDDTNTILLSENHNLPYSFLQNFGFEDLKEQTIIFKRRWRKTFYKNFPMQGKKEEKGRRKRDANQSISLISNTCLNNKDWHDQVNQIR